MIENFIVKYRDLKLLCVSRFSNLSNLSAKNQPGGNGGIPDMCPGTGGGCALTLKAPRQQTKFLFNPTMNSGVDRN